MARLCEYTDERGEKRPGIFHRWGSDFVWGPGDEKIPSTVAIVEDFLSRRVHNVPTNQVTFLESPDPLSPEGQTERAQKILKRLADAER